MGWFKKKKKEPKYTEEEVAALNAINDILSRKWGRDWHGSLENFATGRMVESDHKEDDRGIHNIRTINQFKTPEGDTRYYPGEGKSRGYSLADTKATMDAGARAHLAPADSLESHIVDILKDLEDGLFVFPEGSQASGGDDYKQGK